MYRIPDEDPRHPHSVRALLARVGFDDPWHESRIVHTCTLLPELDPEAHVLDLGTDPLVLHVLAQAGGYRNVVGVTKSETHGSTWTAEFPASGSSGPASYLIHNSDLQRQQLPVESASVDLITCFETIEHLLDPMKMLIEANRVLKPGGRILLSTPNVLSWDTLVRSAGRRHPMHYPALFPDGYTNRHNIEYTPDQIRSLLRAAGFAPVVRTPTVFPWGVWTLRKLAFVLAGVDPRERGDIIFAEGRKTGAPICRWDPTVYELSAEQLARNHDVTVESGSEPDRPVRDAAERG